MRLWSMRRGISFTVSPTTDRQVQHLCLALAAVMGGRIDIKPDHIAQFLDELGIGGELELPHPMRLQPVRSPDALHRTDADPTLFCHHGRGSSAWLQPDRSPSVRATACFMDEGFDGLLRDKTRRSHERFVFDSRPPRARGSTPSRVSSPSSPNND
jgi:hypothetical protein